MRRVTCVDKANVLRSCAFFRAIFDEVAADYPDVEAEHGLIDSTAMYLVTKPGHYNVIVTENMFGDILSDLGAATIGGMGLAPSAEVGLSKGLFQAAHGSAPDIAGKGLANPYGTILSAVSMLDWLGRRNEDARLSAGAVRLRAATESSIRDGVLTRDLKGQADCAAATSAVITRLV